MMQEYCIREKQRQIEEIQDNYNYRAQNTRRHSHWAVIKHYQAALLLSQGRIIQMMGLWEAWTVFVF